MDTPTERGAEPSPTAVVPEPRQRWRLTFARSVPVDGATATGREYISLWETALANSGLPVGTTDAGRLRFAIGAPLPSRTAGRAELADLWLVERLAAWRVREALDGVMPPDHRLVGLEDFWLGAPALSGRVAAADYLVELRGPLDRAAVDAAAQRLLAADRLIRQRAKGGGVKTYDLRPLLVSVELIANAGPGGPAALRFRTRIHPELGSGRPEEVVAALGDDLGAPLEAVETTRERLVLADELDQGRGDAAPDQPSLATSARPGRN